MATKERVTRLSDDGSLHKYRTEIPNTVVKGTQGKGLSVYAKWLYVYLKCVTGEDGECYRNTTTISEESGLPRGTVSRAKAELLKHALITVETGRRANKDTNTIRMVDIWPENMLEFQKIQCTSGEHQCTSGEHQQDIEIVNELNSSVPGGNTGVPGGNAYIRMNKNPMKKKKEPPSVSSPKKIPLPDDFAVTPSMREWFTAHIDHKFVDIDKATEKWKNSMLSHDKRHIDWVATWRNGMLLAEEWAKEKHTTQPVRGKPTLAL